MSKTTIVLDASALLAFFHKETGAERVAQSIRSDSVFMSAVNYAEVGIKHIRNGREINLLLETVKNLHIAVIAFDDLMADSVARLKPKTSAWGLSLADCACLCLAKQLNAVALTADAAWMNLKDDFNVELIRQNNVT